ncbi:MAG: RsmB/NOP family class I SAM-dependent RNA methyltransferase [Shimia sp.]|jgi:16S rRNA (cytosine967-C5)-methyltransferase|uniref:RsmB/NOP family class I SAM-dependent RNA methyltransferase n=1 Tax=Shimia sp. TaxID=1954381 RepID=UPI0040585FDD
MTPAARVQTAIELLDEVFAGTAAEKTLTGWARRSRFAGSKDRAAVRDHVFDALRQRNSASAAGGAADGRGVMIGLLRLQGIAPESLFTGEGYAPGPLSEAEQAIEAPDDLPLDIADWLVAPLRESLGPDFDATVSAMRERAPVSLRVNLRKASVEDAMAVLSEDDIVTAQLELADTAVLVKTNPRRIAQSAAYRDGLVELQDASSQAAVASLSLGSDLKIMDYCAGGGGKILAMAALFGGSYYAHDANPARLRDLPDRAARAGVEVHTLTDSAAEAPYDVVFLDVPCSGSGTWRRTPDAKWRFTEQSLRELNQVQDEILAEAAPLVAENGTLVYATCSLLTAENEDRVDAFLTAYPEWQLEQSRRFSMDQNGDGFFVAQLRRIPA